MKNSFQSILGTLLEADKKSSEEEQLEDDIDIDDDEETSDEEEPTEEETSDEEGEEPTEEDDSDFSLDDEEPTDEESLEEPTEEDLTPEQEEQSEIDSEEESDFSLDDEEGSEDDKDMTQYKSSLPKGKFVLLPALTDEMLDKIEALEDEVLKNYVFTLIDAIDENFDVVKTGKMDELSADDLDSEDEEDQEDIEDSQVEGEPAEEEAMDDEFKAGIPEEEGTDETGGETEEEGGKSSMKESFRQVLMNEALYKIKRKRRAPRAVKLKRHLDYLRKRFSGEYKVMRQREERKREHNPTYLSGLRAATTAKQKYPASFLRRNRFNVTAGKKGV